MAVALYVQIITLWMAWEYMYPQLERLAHRMPESARALCRMVSLTAAKTRRILDVSVAWVRLNWVSFRNNDSLE